MAVAITGRDQMESIRSAGIGAFPEAGSKLVLVAGVAGALLRGVNSLCGGAYTAVYAPAVV